LHIVKNLCKIRVKVQREKEERKERRKRESEIQYLSPKESCKAGSHLIRGTIPN